MSAQDRGWGPGWPNCPYGKIQTLVRDDGLRLPVRSELLGLTRRLIDRTESLGYDVRPDWTWGFACRAISGTSTASNHSWGLAVDINAPRNPYASASWHRRNATSRNSTFPFGLRIVTDLTEPVVAMWEDTMFRWGGRYRNHPDPMHFEFMGTPADARRLTDNLEPGGPMASQLDRIEAHLKGRDPGDGSEPHRKFVHEQHKHTRNDILEQAENTRTTVAWTVQKQTNEIESLIAEQTRHIEDLAGQGPDGPTTITDADLARIAAAVAPAVIEALKEQPLAPTEL